MVVERPWARGFTLLEVMIALAIVSVALVALLSLGNRSVAVQTRLQRLTQATLLAQQKMAETEVSSRQGKLERRRQEGNFSAPYAEYRWRLDFAETPLPSVVLATITVAWGNEKKNEAVDVSSFLF
ncbi:MAG: type II secretion system minor pseudopilin GspI [Desulfuromonadales bacterium]|nr:type II secretion system minor pseudopilin GspI [Desulfuromonadales bacterium]